MSFFNPSPLRPPNAEIFVSVELLRMILDLPASYRIVGAANPPQQEGATITLLVVAGDLPVLQRGELRYLLTPIMERVDTGQVQLRELQITSPQERAHPFDVMKVKL